ncbi:transmembrane reductase CYB561D2-like [Xenia sp. Carnegie-2017]|uniref:transmembrane reductase CYB561D2-like n=1 Tax=Xenia sp. Carnegie-2017 TaxID=2897299 RepID=UPI001F036DDA|nr:transmembrane reductase CYB561D2-like [Xenia sp. Carnegie-2017]
MFHIMSHVIALGLVTYICWFAVPGTSLFSWHPTLMILGFGFFMLEAILIFSKNSNLFPNATQAVKVRCHWILQILATSCAVGGFLVIFINKNRSNKPHFISWHGILGAITMFLTCIQTSMGTGLLYPKLPLFNTLKLVTLKRLHALSGALFFILSCLVIFLSLYSNWFVRKAGLYTLSWWTCAVCIIMLAVFVNNQIAQVYLFKKK